MKLDQILVRSSRIGLSFIMLLSLHTNSAFAAAEAGLLPIEKSQVNKSLIDDLFNPDQSGDNGDDEDNGINQNRNNNVNPNKNKNKNGNGQGRGKGGGKNGGNNYNKNASPQMEQAEINDDFKCNLFESMPYQDILSAVNALNSAINSPACGDAKVNTESIVENNKEIVEAIKALREYKEGTKEIKPEDSGEIITNVDRAIRAATTVANSFAQSDVLKKECRQAMSGGEVALAVNDLINGLTPYALMAAPYVGAASATPILPFIVGGAVVTGAVASMAKIISESSVNVKDPTVRRAIVENTCQYIRLDQRYKFLIKSRQEQISKISADISSTQRLFSAKVDGVTGGTNGMMDRKHALDKVALEVNNALTTASQQMQLDQQVVKSTSDDIMVCQMGVQMAAMAKDRKSYVAATLNALDQAMVAYGSNSIAQANALKMSSSIALKNLDQVAKKQASHRVDFQACAANTKSLMETINQAGNLSKQLIKLAQDEVEKNLQNNREYALVKARLSTLSQKQIQADLVTESLDNLKATANAIAQSEINSEMERLRRGLFQNGAFGALGSASPVLAWFKHVQGLHQAKLKNFKEGLAGLQLRAHRMTKSGSNFIPMYPGAYQANKVQLEQDQLDAQNMVPFNLKQLPLGTREHDDVCRELSDVWNRWTVTVEDLAAMDAFCSMIEPYVFDTRPEDASLVQMCRGYSKASAKSGSYGARLSTIAQAKEDLVKSKTRDWALFVQKKMDALICLED